LNAAAGVYRYNGENAITSRSRLQFQQGDHSLTSLYCRVGYRDNQNFRLYTCVGLEEQVVGIIGGILSFVLIGIPIPLALFILILVRSVVALLKAQKQESIADPKTWLF
tara:strand:- start:59 stop:385 length:327 start_codon:yes stop_codon:yes gene_type:complete